MHCQAPATPTTAPHQTVIDCWQVVFEETTGNFHDSLREGRWSRRECVVVATNGVVLICELCIFATFSHCWQLDLPQVAHATTTLCKVALAEALRNFGFTDSRCRAENNKPNTHRHASNIYVCVCVSVASGMTQLIWMRKCPDSSGRRHNTPSLEGFTKAARER